MENSTILVGLLSGLSVFFTPFVDSISALMHSMPNTSLTVASGISVAKFAWANGCCICIPIPIAFGLFALHRRATASA